MKIYTILAVLNSNHMKVKMSEKKRSKDILLAK